jgi:muramoyltetrapeptide carboxypeptidase LdcA involved in peptidoglycan recycling
MKSKKQLLEALEYLEEHAIAYVFGGYSESKQQAIFKKIDTRVKWLKELIEKGGNE